MAFEDLLKSISLSADASIAAYTGVPGLPGSAAPNTGNQYRFVKVTDAQTAGLCVAGDGAIGVVQNKPQVVGQAATVAIFGVSLVVAGEAIAAGDLITSDAAGKAAVVGAGDATNGVAITAGSAGELVSVLLKV